MAHAYQSLESGAQIIISDEPREDLEALARWESIEPAEAKNLIAKAEKAAKTEGAADEAAAAELAAVAPVEAEAAAKTAAALAAAGKTPPDK